MIMRCAVNHFMVLKVFYMNLKYEKSSSNSSHAFGFGLMDAGAMVKLAKDWTNVPPQKASP